MRRPSRARARYIEPPATASKRPSTLYDRLESPIIVGQRTALEQPLYAALTRVGSEWNSNTHSDRFMDPRADELTNSEVTLGEACAGALTGVKDRSTAQHGTRCFCLRTRNLVALFGRERKAVAAVEFALVGLVGLELLVEIMQAGTYFYTSAGVERATSKAVRQILTGAVNSAGYTATQFRANVLCPAISGTNLSCGNVITNIQTVSEAPSPGGFYALLNSSQTGLLRPPLDNSQTTYCTGTSQSYVFVQILYAMPVFSPIWRVWATTYNGSPSYILQSSAAFRNEPFAPGSQSC